MTATSWLAISTPSIGSRRLTAVASAPLRAAYASLLRCRRNEAGERLSRPLRNASSRLACASALASSLTLGIILVRDPRLPEQNLTDKPIEKPRSDPSSLHSPQNKIRWTCLQKRKRRHFQSGVPTLRRVRGGNGNSRYVANRGAPESSESDCN
jgi:hypothetical protein